MFVHFISEVCIELDSYTS